MGVNPESSIPNAASLDAEVWAAESLKIAETFVYAGIGASDKTTVLSDAYVTAGVKIAETRIAAGGYRLAHVLESLDLTTKLN
jgi:hypothetical protein